MLAYRRKITTGTREWADHNVNCIRGCFNNCRYCYAKMMAKRFKRSTDDGWKTMTIREDVLKRNFRRLPGRVMFPSTHDIVDIPPFKEACFVALGKLLKSKNVVLVTTKPRLTVIKEIADRFQKYKSQIQFRFTITSIRNETLEFWEPNAPRFGERLSCLRFAFLRGFRTSVSIEPFLDYNPTELVEIVEPFITESVWVGRMNYISRIHASKDEEPYYNEVRKNYETPHLLEIFNRLKGHSNIRFKDSIKIQLGVDNTQRNLGCR